jgi:hypothetical protein
MDLEELLFVGNTYVYRGPYPRSDGSKGDHQVERYRGRRGEAPAEEPIVGTGPEKAGREDSESRTEDGGE